MRKNNDVTIFSPELEQSKSIQRFDFGDRISGYGYFNWRHMVLGALFGTKSASVISVPLPYNPGYFSFVQSLIKEGFLKRILFRGSYNDYPKSVGMSVIYIGDVADTESTLPSSSNVSPEEGLNICISKCVGEALERHAAKFTEMNRMYYPKVFTTKPSFSYSDIPQFTDVQKKKFQKFVASEKDMELMSCAKVPNLTRGGKGYIPLQCLYFGNSGDVSQKVLYQTTTNACGGGFTYEQATLSAIYEHIERDHFFLWWYSGMAPRRLTFDEMSPFGKKILEATKKYGLEVYILDTSYDVAVASCVCVLVDTKLNIMAMGGKAGSCEDVYENAYYEALALLSSSRGYVASGERGRFFTNQNDFTDARMGKRERETQCCNPDAIDLVKSTFLSGAPKSAVERIKLLTMFRSEKEELSFLKNEFIRLSKRNGDGYNLFVHTFDSKWLRECSFVAVRAFVPSFINLHLNENFATPLSARLKMFMEDHDKEYSYDVINKLPHFFP